MPLPEVRHDQPTSRLTALAASAAPQQLPEVRGAATPDEVMRTAHRQSRQTGGRHGTKAVAA
jgi:hypothetical protein